MSVLAIGSPGYGLAFYQLLVITSLAAAAWLVSSAGRHPAGFTRHALNTGRERGSLVWATGHPPAADRSRVPGIKCLPVSWNS